MKLMERAGVDKQDVRNMDEATLSEMGVLKLDGPNLILKCKACGETWEPQLDSGGKLSHDYWVCPLDCNAEKMTP